MTKRPERHPFKGSLKGSLTPASTKPMLTSVQLQAASACSSSNFAILGEAGPSQAERWCHTLRKFHRDFGSLLLGQNFEDENGTVYGVESPGQHYYSQTQVDASLLESNWIRTWKCCEIPSMAINSIHIISPIMGHFVFVLPGLLLLMGISYIYIHIYTPWDVSSHQIAIPISVFSVDNIHNACGWLWPCR